MQTFYLVFLCFLVDLPIEVSAHQPRIVEGETIDIGKPEIFRACYEVLSGHPLTYIINSLAAFGLYISIVVPLRILTLIDEYTRKCLS